MSMIGTCKLCHSEGVELMDSHLMAKTFYKKIRYAEGANNSLVVASKEFFRFTDKQTSDYVLCRACEERFGKVEDWVSGQCLQPDGSFPLRDAVVAQPLYDDIAAISGKAAHIDVIRYVYFASSILWRAGAHVWGKSSTIKLGSYEEQLRLYLLSQTPFPTDIAIGVTVATRADTRDQFAITPAEFDTKGCYHYQLTVPGIQFTFMLGQRMPKEVRSVCFLRSTENFVFLTDHLDRRAIANLLRTARVTKRVQRGADLYKQSGPRRGI